MLLRTLFFKEFLFFFWWDYDFLISKWGFAPVPHRYGYVNSKLRFFAGNWIINVWRKLMYGLKKLNVNLRVIFEKFRITGVGIQKKSEGNVKKNLTKKIQKFEENWSDIIESLRYINEIWENENKNAEFDNSANPYDNNEWPEGALNWIDLNTMNRPNSIPTEMQHFPFRYTCTECNSMLPNLCVLFMKRRLHFWYGMRFQMYFRGIFRNLMKNLGKNLKNFRIFWKHLG